MRVLILSQWYAPEPHAGRVVSLAEGLALKGHEVTVVTGFPNYPQGHLYSGYSLSWRQWEETNGVRLLRLPLYPDQSRSILKRSLNYLSFSASSMALAPALTRDFDVLWAFTALVGIPAMWIAFWKRVPFVMDIADLWPETLIATGMFREGLVTNALARLGNAVYARADRLTIQNHGFINNLVEKGIPRCKLHVVDNIADSSIYRPLEPDPALGRKFGLEGKFNLMFAGTMGLGQGLGSLIRAAVLLKSERQVQFVFIGAGADLDRTKALAHELGTENVLFLPQQPADRIAEFFAHAGALLVHLRKDPLFECMVPSKTQSSLACGKPILMALNGEGAHLIDEAEAGLTCPPDDPRALAETVLKLVAMPRTERDRLAENALALFRRRFTKQVMVDSVERILTQAVAARL